MLCTWFLGDTYLSAGVAAPTYRTYHHTAYICPKCGTIWLRRVLHADRPWDCRCFPCPEHGLGTSLYEVEARSIFLLRELATERGAGLLTHEFLARMNMKEYPTK